jgi:hypothetical protein
MTTLTKQYPIQNTFISNQETVAVQNPAASPSGELISQITQNGLTADKAITAIQLNAETYLIILSLTVSGNPVSSDKVPGLVVGYSFDQGGSKTNSVEGTTSNGTSVVSGFVVSESAEVEHNGQGVVSAGTVGGLYTSDWTYSVTISIYKL